MKYDSLELLCCPVCKSKLSYRGKREDEVIREGNLHCQNCGQDYPIVDGIPRFISPSKLFGLNKVFEKAYHRISYVYDSAFTRAYLHKHFWPSVGEDDARREVIKSLEINNDSKVLETSIGTGDNIPHIFSCAHGVKVYGLDISARMLQQCIKNLKNWKLEAELFLGNAEELPFQDNSFDVVYHVGGINFFTDKKKAIDEMVRVAKPGIRIVIACETEKAIKSNRVGIRLAFGKQLTETMLKFCSKDICKLVPENMPDIRFEQIWEGNGYLLEFKKPLS